MRQCPLRAGLGFQLSDNVALRDREITEVEILVCGDGGLQEGLGDGAGDGREGGAGEFLGARVPEAGGAGGDIDVEKGVSESPGRMRYAALTSAI